MTLITIMLSKIELGQTSSPRGQSLGHIRTWEKRQTYSLGYEENSKVALGLWENDKMLLHALYLLKAPFILSLALRV